MSLFKSASVVSLWTLVSRITGLARQLVIAAMFGAGPLTDAFMVAFRIPNMLRRLFAEGAFSQAFVPLLAANKQTEGVDATKVLINQVASLLLWVLVLTSALGVVAAPALVYVLASGLEPDAFDSSVWMTRIMFPYIGFMSLVALCSAVLNTWKNFAVPAATPVLLNVAMIASSWALAPWLQQRGIAPIYALSCAVMLGGALQLGLQLWALRRLQLLPRFEVRPWRAAALATQPGVKRMLMLMLPALLGVSVAQLSLVINTQIASHLAPGSVSWLGFADLLMEFPTAMLGVALGVVLMPQLAAAQASGDVQRFSAMIDWGLRLVCLLALPSAVALLCFSEPLVAVLYHYGAFKAMDVQQVSAALMGYGVGLTGLIAIKVLAPGYYAQQDIKTPVRIAVVVLVVTQLLNLVLVPRLQHAGLALSIGLGALLNAAWLLTGLIRCGAYRPSKGWLAFAARVLFACGLLAVFLLWCAQALPWVAMQAHSLTRLLWFVAVLATCAVLYFGACWATGLPLKAMLKR